MTFFGTIGAMLYLLIGYSTGLGLYTTLTSDQFVEDKRIAKLAAVAAGLMWPFWFVLGLILFAVTASSSKE